MVTTLQDQQSFEKAISKPQLSVIHFAADWAEQCKQVSDVFETLSKQPEYKKKVKFYTLPAEDVPEVSLKYKIEAAPTVVLFISGENVGRVEGADVAKITSTVKELSEDAEEAENLEQRLKKLISKEKVMLFMKGDRNQPRCGFSRQMIEILNNTGVAYETFDILTDEEVRQGLKEYSDWPTYPQLYVDADLIGGLDIVKELIAAGEFETTLKGNS